MLELKDYDGLYPDDLLETVKLMITDNLKYMDALNLFASFGKDDLLSHHLDLGMDIRNHYKMWDDDNIQKYVSACTEYQHPDDLSFIWLLEAQRQLVAENV